MFCKEMITASPTTTTTTTTTPSPACTENPRYSAIVELGGMSWMRGVGGCLR